MKNRLPGLSFGTVAAAGILAVVILGLERAAEGTAAPNKNDSPYTVRGDRPAANAKQALPEPAKENFPPGDLLLAQSINQLERRTSVSAKLVHQARIGKHVFSGTGSYLQQGNGDNLRVRMTFSLVAQRSHHLQVSNSRFLWIEEQLPTGRKVTRIDLRELRAKPSASAAGTQRSLSPGEADWSPLEPELAAHAGGLPSLLAALQKNFTFLSPQAMRLALDQSSDTEPTTIPVFAVVGHWRPERLALLVNRPDLSEELASPAGGSPETSPADGDSYVRLLRSLPPRIPQEVLVLVGQTDSFPYWIEYRPLETPIAANRNGAVIPYQISSQPTVVLELSKVVFDKQIPAGQFDYSPGETEWVDRTAERIQRLWR